MMHLVTETILPSPVICGSYFLGSVAFINAGGLTPYDSAERFMMTTFLVALDQTIVASMYLTGDFMNIT